MFDAKVLIKRLPFFSVPKITVIRHVKVILKLQLTWQIQTVLWKNARTLKAWNDWAPGPHDKNLTMDLKVKLVRALVWSALIYGAEAWTLFKSDENRIMAAEMRMRRRLLNVSWKEKRTNASILSELDVKRELFGKDNDLGYVGHIMRNSGSPLTKQTEEEMIEWGERKRERQKKQLYDNIIDYTGLSYTKAKRKAQDSTAWRRVVKKGAEVVANHQKWRRQKAASRGPQTKIWHVLCPISKLANILLKNDTCVL